MCGVILVLIFLSPNGAEERYVPFFVLFVYKFWLLLLTTDLDLSKPEPSILWAFCCLRMLCCREWSSLTAFLVTVSGNGRANGSTPHRHWLTLSVDSLCSAGLNGKQTNILFCVIHWRFSLGLDSCLPVTQTHRNLIHSVCKFKGYFGCF